MTIDKFYFIVGKMIADNEAFKLVFTNNELLREDIREIYDDGNERSTTWNDFVEFIDANMPTESEKWSGEQFEEMENLAGDITLSEYGYDLGEETLSMLQLTHDVDETRPYIVGRIIGSLEFGSYNSEVDFELIEKYKNELRLLGWISKLYVVQDDCNCCS
jgi:hypothetical protein